MRRVLREKGMNAKPLNPQGWQTNEGGPEMQPQEPLSIFRKPEPAPASKRPALSPVQRTKLSCAFVVFSVAVLIVLVAADIASAADYCFKNGF
jgi:hypothetical protein